MPGTGQTLLLWQYGNLGGVISKFHCCTNVSDLNHFHVLSLQHQRHASVPAVPATAFPQVPSTRMCHDADDDVVNRSVSVLVLLSQQVCWPNDCESGETSVTTAPER